MAKRKICVVTGARAEYGLLYWLLKEIQSDSQLNLQLIVTGMHLSPEFGLTYKTIEKDGFKIDAKIETQVSSDTSVGVAKSLGLGVIGFADALDRLRPDILVALGDRYETFAAVQAAFLARIPVAHLHGGETTESAFDEGIRHSITKMSLWHFVMAETFRKRVIQLGESPDRVFTFGTVGLDNIHKLKRLDRKSLEKAIGFKFGKVNFLVTHHPVTLSDPTAGVSEMKALLAALDRFPEARIVFTKPNADTGSKGISVLMDDYVRKNAGRVAAYASLGQLNYLSAVDVVDVIIGNSSSGLIEVPAMRKATVNVGERQAGRLRASSVIDAEGTEAAIFKAIQKALSPEFQKSLKKISTPYGQGGDVSRKIKNQLKKLKLGDRVVMKKFYDLG